MEKRRRPNVTGNSGVAVPWTIACTAIGSAGVEVSPLVGVAAGEGVRTKDVGEIWFGAAVWVGEPREVGGAVAVRAAIVCVARAGAAGAWLAWPSTRTSTAIKAERKLKISEPRARTMYFCR